MIAVAANPWWMQLLEVLLLTVVVLIWVTVAVMLVALPVVAVVALREWRRSRT